MPAALRSPPHGWPVETDASHNSSSVRPSSQKANNCSTSRSAQSSALGSSDDDASSTQIIVDNDESLKHQLQSYWYQTKSSEVSAEPQLPSFKHEAEPDWMREPPDQTMTIQRSHKLNFARWAYAYPPQKKLSSQKSSPSVTSKSFRRTKAETEAEATNSLSSQAMTDSPADVITSKASEQVPHETAFVSAGRSRALRPERSIYVTPPSRGQTLPIKDAAPLHDSAPSNHARGQLLVEQVRTVAPHRRNNAEVVQSPSASATSKSDSVDHGSTGRPPAGLSETSAPVSKKPGHISVRDHELLKLRRGKGIQDEAGAMRSISEVLSRHQILPTNACISPEPEGVINGHNKDLPARSDTKDKDCGQSLSFDAAAILAQSREAPIGIEGLPSIESQRCPSPMPSDKTMTPSPISRKSNQGSILQDPNAESHIAENAFNGERLSDEGVDHRSKSKDHVNGKVILMKKVESSRDTDSTTDRQSKSKGKNRINHEKAANGGVKVGGASHADLEDWHAREPYYNPAERRAVASAFAEEQANNTLDEVVDTTSREFREGLDVLVDGQEDICAEKDRDKQEPRRADSLGQMVLMSSQKTSNDHANARINLKDHPRADLVIDHNREFKKMSKADKQAVTKFQTGPNPYAPEADIYLRPAETGDASQINDIWNFHIQNSINVGYDYPWTAAAWPEMIRQDTGIRLPFLVAVLKHGKKGKRAKNEHIVGFGRAIPCGDDTNAFRFSVELEIYVRNQSFRMGVGKTLFDRLMAAVAGPPYFTKNCAPLIGVTEPGLYDDGMFRRCHTIMVSVFHDGPDDASLKWKEAFLTANEYEKAGCIAKYGFKFGRFYDMTQYYFHTNLTINPSRYRG